MRPPVPVIVVALSAFALALGGCGSGADGAPGAEDNANICVQVAADDSRLCGDDARDICAQNPEAGNSLLLAGYIDDSVTSEDHACRLIDPSLEAPEGGVAP